VLDDLKSKGNAQINRYASSTPSIQSTVEQQLSNIQDSYNSLYNTAQQIKARLEESLLKFKQYEDMLESIWSNLDDYEPLMNKSLDENWSLEESKEKLTLYRVNFNIILTLTATGFKGLIIVFITNSKRKILNLNFLIHFNI
jgi:chromosome segregation ATPase